MRKPILIRGARQLITLRGHEGARCGADLGQLGVVMDGSVLIVNGRIRKRVRRAALKIWRLRETRTRYRQRVGS